MSIIDFTASFSELYERRMAPVSSSFHLTAIELSILLFLANNPNYDTAKDIVDKRHLTKSHVSISLRDLEERGLIRKERRNGDNRKVHLVLLSSSDDIIREGQKAQSAFLSAVTTGLSASDMEQFQSYIDRMNENVLASLREIRKEAVSR
ncbi:MAG: MarR family transcriptional regulator [Clostridia bacterium]|nr:MarR family transcriptional regulator [Clostridia bacterium]